MKIGITINFDINFFANGLQQNIVILSNLLNSLDNFSSFFIFQGDKTNQQFVNHNSCIPYHELFKENNFDFDIVILMGFSINKQTLMALKKQNKKTKYILMQCGNQYIENMTYSLFEKNNISPVDDLPELDEIWILPHYQKNISYMKTYYKTEKVKIVPYLWQSLFIDHQLKHSKNLFNKKAPHLINNKGVIVMEPNLNSSKNCILPLYIVESFDKKFPNKINSCNLLSAEALAKNEYFIKLILQLNIYKNRPDFLKVHKRKTLINSISSYGSIVISHQQDNGLNNLYFEVLYLGLPLLHNSRIISDYGYFYSENNIDEAVKQLELILNSHKNDFSRYKIRSDKFINLYSPENIKNKKSYYELIQNIN